jgi:hypothetical protein
MGSTNQFRSTALLSAVLLPCQPALCVLLPALVPFHLSSLSVQRAVPFSGHAAYACLRTDTQLLTNSSTVKHVRCRCTFALWHDAPKLQHNAQDACDPAHTDTPVSEAPAAAPASTPLFLSDTRCRQLCMQQVLQPRPCLTVVLVVATTSPSVSAPSMASNCLPLQRQSQW